MSSGPQEAKHGSPDNHYLVAAPHGSPRPFTDNKATPSSAVGTGAGVNYGRLAHGALRGRYIWVALLSVVSMGLFAALGWKVGRPIYHSEGLLRIAYTLPEIIQETDQNKPLAMFDTFMQSQRLLITSRRVLDVAVQDRIWQAHGRQVPPEPEQYFARHLQVDIKPRSEFILITVRDYDPATAAAAVTSVVNAYQDLYRNTDKTLERQRIGVLEDKQADLQGRIDGLNQQIGGLGKEFGSTKLDTFYDAAAERVTKLQSTLADLRMAIVAAEAAPTPGGQLAQGAGGPTTQPAPQVAALTAEQIAMTDPVMRHYLDEQSRYESELANLTRSGYGDAHKSVEQAKRSLEDARARVAKYGDMYREFHATAAAPNVGGGSKGTPVLVTVGKSVQVLKANEASLKKLYKEAYDEMVALGNKRLELSALGTKVEALKTELAQTTHRIDVLRAEGQLGGRLSIISSGEIPLSPDKDPRLLTAAAGAAGGAVLPPALVVLVALLKRKYRYSDEPMADLPTSIPLLGIMPELPDDGSDAEQAMAAAHSVHQLRVSLRAKAPHRASSVYLVTSATAGEGKTTLAMSLALSFAASRQRTLIVDCDLVGRRLTSAVEARDLEGLHESLAAGSIRKRVRKADGGLYMLTAGRAGAPDAYGIPASGIRSLLAEARQHFDVVIIDSGPILGSIEAAVLAQEVDGVVFTIVRGQERGLVRKALARLNSLHVNVAGLVFNRAKAEDFHGSPHGSSSRASITSSSAEPAALPRCDSFARLGPLVGAVAGAASREPYSN